jgi:tight adherence protein B
VTAILIVLLALASWLAFPPQGASCRRAGTALASTGARISPRPGRAPADRRVLGRILGGRALRAPPVPMTVVVQQLAALLRGGRRPARLWDELWLLYGRNAAQGQLAEDGAGPKSALAPESVALLAAARAAALRGASVAQAIRSGGPPASSTGKTIGNGTGGDGRERRVWGELAACFDIAEASGCPLADVLTRFAAQLEAEDDAEAARQTALAGPKATARLLTWLPLLGLGLGTLLGVDPVKILLQTPFGMAALAAGVVLTAAGRVWSSQLVRAAGAPL